MSQQNFTYKEKDNECDKLKKDNELKESTITDLQKKNDQLKTQVRIILMCPVYITAILTL